MCIYVYSWAQQALRSPLLLFNYHYLHRFLSQWDIIIMKQTVSSRLPSHLLSSPLLFLCLLEIAGLLARNGSNSRRLKKQWTCCYQSWKAWNYCNALFEVKHGCVSCDKCTSKQSGCLAARAVSPVMAFGLCSVPADIIYLWQLCLCSLQRDYQCRAGEVCVGVG